MRSSIALLGILLSSTLCAQDDSFTSSRGTWIASLGWEGGFYFNEVETNLFGYDTTYTDTAGAVFFPISIEYCPLNKFSCGLVLRPGRYLEDNPSESNSAFTFDVTASYHLLEKKRNDLYVRMNLGSSSLTIENSTWQSRGEWSGFHFGLSLGYRHYFGEHVGFYLSLGNNRYAFRQKSLTAGNTEIDPEDLSWDMNLRGTEFSLGLVGKF